MTTTTMVAAMPHDPITLKSVGMAVLLAIKVGAPVGWDHGP